jgi:hypothetical protein
MDRVLAEDDENLIEHVANNAHGYTRPKCNCCFCYMCVGPLHATIKYIFNPIVSSLKPDKTL